ncbi:MAG: deoxyribonuclease IV [Halobacteriaceae archaeon]
MLGSNIPLSNGLARGIEIGDDWGCESVQVYTTPSRTWDVPDLNEEKIDTFKDALEESGISEVVAHIPFLVNLASNDRNIRKKSKDRLLLECQRAERMGIENVVLHPGSHNSKKREGMNRVIEGLIEVMDLMSNPSVNILLETMAGQGTMLGSSFDELSYMIDKLDGLDNFGVCFDTAHVFMAGYDIRGGEYNRVMSLFDDKVGKEAIMAVHLNDSKTSLGSNHDRHACIGDGELGLKTFYDVLQDEELADIPKILELPKRDERSKQDLELLRELDEYPKKYITGEEDIATQSTFESDFK